MSANYYELLKYAATGIASPDMTYFDRMRASTPMGGVVQTLTGIPPLSFKSNGKPLISWSMLGNGSQTGTPTPDAPIMPTFCGVRTANLAPPIGEWVDGYIGSNGRVATPSATYMEKSSDFLEIPNDAVSVAFSGEDGGFEKGSSGGWRAIGFYDSNKVFVSRAGGSGFDGMSASVPESAKFMRLSCRTYGSDKEYMLNAGSTALPYEPYGYKIPITCGGDTAQIYIGDPLRKALDGSNAVDVLSSAGTITREVDTEGNAIATPTTQAVAVHEIPTAKGQNTLTVDTDLQPSEMTIKYRE